MGREREQSRVERSTVSDDRERRRERSPLRTSRRERERSPVRKERSRSREHSPSTSSRRHRERERHHDDRDRFDRNERDRRRSRSRSPRDRRESRDDVGSSKSKRHEREKKDDKKQPEPPKIDIDTLLSGEDDMMSMMGFGGFDTTKNKKVDGNFDGVSKVNKPRKYRQYMNRKGGFNRPLDYIS